MWLDKKSVTLLPRGWVELDLSLLTAHPFRKTVSAAPGGEQGIDKRTDHYETEEAYFREVGTPRHLSNGTW